MNEEQKKNLVRTIEQAQEWDKIPTNVEGLFVVKPPEQNNRQMVFIELIPTVNGRPTKKKGLFLKTEEDLESYKDLLENPKTKELLEVISEYYGIKKTPKIEI